MIDKPELPIPQMEQFRDELREMAAREIDAERARGVTGRSRRRSRRVGGLVVAVVAVAAGVAGGSQLISTGEPVKRDHVPPAAISSTGAPLRIAVVAADKALGRSWGVQIYDKPGGVKCALAGQVRGSQLGIVTNKRFHPYEQNAPSSCGRPGPTKMGIEIQDFKTDPPRTLIYGRTGARVRAVRLQVPGGRFRATTGRDGVFMFVLALRDYPFRAVTVTPLDSRGHALK